MQYDCDGKYIGQNKRMIIRKFCLFKVQKNQLQLGTHFIETDHSYNRKNIKLLKETVRQKFVNAWLHGNLSL